MVKTEPKTPSRKRPAEPLHDPIHKVPKRLRPYVVKPAEAAPDGAAEEQEEPEEPPEEADQLEEAEEREEETEAGANEADPSGMDVVEEKKPDDAE